MGWEANRVEHTFPSGHTAVLRRSVPATWLMQQAARRGDDDAAKALAEILAGEQSTRVGASLDVMATIVEVMWLEPRVDWDGEAVFTDDGEAVVLSGDMLSDEEIDETLRLAFEGVAQAATFRGDGDGPGGGGDGPPVGKSAKRAAGAAKRKPGGPRGGQAVGGPAGG